MEFDEYQRATLKTAIYPDKGKRNPNAINYAVLGLIGEAGEIANAWKKAIRDSDPTTAIEKIRWELGDVLWYIARAADEIGMKLSDVAQANLDKLADRGHRGKLTGSGDKR